MAAPAIPDWLIARVAAATGRSPSSGASMRGSVAGNGGAATGATAATAAAQQAATDAPADAPVDAHPLSHLSTAERLDLLARTKFPDGGGFIVVEEGEDAPVKLRDNLELHNLYLVRNLMDVYGVQPRLSMFLTPPTCPSLPELRHAQHEKDAKVKLSEARVLQSEGNIAKALDSYTSSIVALPTREALLERARLYALQKQWSQAEGDLVHARAMGASAADMVVVRELLRQALPSAGLAGNGSSSALPSSLSSGPPPPFAPSAGAATTSSRNTSPSARGHDRHDRRRGYELDSPDRRGHKRSR